MDRPVVKMKDPYSEAGTEGQFEDDVSERHRSGGMFSSEEVSSMTSDQFIAVMRSAGEKQRWGMGYSGVVGGAESFALTGQRLQSEKLGRESWINRDYGSALENVGDVYHRMTAAPAYPMDESEVWGANTLGKTSQAVSHLERASHSDYPNASEEQREWGEGYSESHAQLPVYTAVQQLANQSAIHLGRHQFGPSMEALGTMRNMEIAHNEAQPPEPVIDWEGGTPIDFPEPNPDTEYNRQMSQPGSIEFLRSQGR
jgi:hypothetical protein